LYLKSTQRITHSVDLASVATTKLLNVVFNDRGEGGPIANVVDPTRELRVPDEGVTTDELAVAGGPVDKGIGTTKVELTTVGLGRIPLHGVLGRKLTEVAAENSSVGSNVERVRISASTPEFLALGTEPSMKTSGRRGSGRGGSGRGSRCHASRRCGRRDSSRRAGSGDSGSGCRSTSRGIGWKGFHQSEVGWLGNIALIEQQRA